MLSIPQEIKDKMTKLQAEMECLKLSAATLVVDDPFEWLVVAQTENLSHKVKDLRQCTAAFIEKMKGSNPDDARILSLMVGKKIEEKKKELIQLIKQYPVLGSVDKDIFYQRVKLFKLLHEPLSHIECPATPLKDSIEKLKQEENNDEDFLE